VSTFEIHFIMAKVRNYSKLHSGSRSATAKSSGSATLTLWCRDAGGGAEQGAGREGGGGPRGGGGLPRRGQDRGRHQHA
jgi:hypothetical protein